MRRVLRTLAILQIVTAPLSARMPHEPQEPINLIPAMRHVMEGAAAVGPSNAARGSQRAGDSARSPGTSTGRTPSARRRPGDMIGAANGQPRGLSAIDRVVSSDDLIELGRRSGNVLDFRPHGPGAAVPLLERLAPARAEQIVSKLRPHVGAGTQHVARRTERRRHSSVDSTGRPDADPAVSLADAERLIPTQNLDGSGHMEMHWTAESVGLSTFVGGSQAEEDAHSTAFGRDIGAAAGLQFTDSSSWAYRLMVARSFKNDLDAPMQAAKLRFEVNVRF